MKNYLLNHPDRFHYITGINNFPAIKINHPDQSEAIIYLHGAHLTSLKLAGSEELLYLSPNAIFEQGTAIRGGVPIIFPQFAALGDLRFHGFARISDWSVVNDQVDISGNSVMELSLINDESHFQQWQYKFELKLILSLGSKLKMTMQITNLDLKDFKFSNAFHTYFAVTDINQTEISNLKGINSVDYLDQQRSSIEENDPIIIKKHTDKIYLSAPAEVTIRDKLQKREIKIVKNNFQDLVIWNPWDKAASMKDMTADGYQKMLCVEVANTHNPISLGSVESFICDQEISVISK
jgi:glucose-6-phosphate 1-epimerase